MQLPGPKFPRSRTSSPDIQKHAKLLKLSEWNSESRIFVKHFWALQNKIARIAYEKPNYFLFSYIYILKVRDLTAGIKCFIPQEDIILDEFRFGRIEAGREVAYHQERSGGHWAREWTRRTGGLEDARRGSWIYSDAKRERGWRLEDRMSPCHRLAAR